MLGVCLHGAKNLRVERIPRPGPPSRGQALVLVKATGICGSDLHCYLDARIGDTSIDGPLVLGHEFSGVIEAVGPDSLV
jgi:L-iditol 2-dehydrogenase